MVETRPFQGYWKHFKEFDKKRSNQEIQGYLNTLHAFAKDISIMTFLHECKKIVSVTEMAFHYKNKLENQADLEKFLEDVARTTTHEWVLYFAIYYSSWTGSMVLEKDKVFSEFDQAIIQRTMAAQLQGPSVDRSDNQPQYNQLQFVLQQIVKIIGFEQWKKHLKDLNINRNIGILKEKYVVSIEYICNLDVIEARHQLDNLVCYSGLKDTTFFDLQKGLQIHPTLQSSSPFQEPLPSPAPKQPQAQIQGWGYGDGQIEALQEEGSRAGGKKNRSTNPPVSNSSVVNPVSQTNTNGLGISGEIVMGIPSSQILGEPQDMSHASHVIPPSSVIKGEPKKEEVKKPDNLFAKLSKAIVAVQSENHDSQVQNLCSLIDKMTPRLFMKACQERGDGIMDFIGPEIKENGGNVKKGVECVGDYVSDVVWNEILQASGLIESQE